MANHVIFESSNLKSSKAGKIYDVIVSDTGAKGGTNADTDNGVLIKVGDYTGDGLQTRYAKVAAKADKVAILGSPALVKDAFTKAQADPTNFYNKAGVAAKAYELVKEDIFAVSKIAFTTDSQSAIAVGAFVSPDGSGKLVAATDAATDTGFVGKVHSLSVGDNVTMVRVEVIKNEKYVAPAADESDNKSEGEEV